MFRMFTYFGIISKTVTHLFIYLISAYMYRYEYRNIAYMYVPVPESSIKH